MALFYKPPHVPDFRRLRRNLVSVANVVAAKAVEAFAERERALFVQRIRRQQFRSFSAAPLTPRWYRRKLAKGADTRVMLATGHMVRSIQVFTRKTGRVTTFHVGFHRLARARDLDGHTVPITLHRMARVHEHGSARMNVPARPHWGPHLADMRTRAVAVRAAIGQEVLAILGRRLFRRR